MATDWWSTTKDLLGGVGGVISSGANFAETALNWGSSSPLVGAGLQAWNYNQGNKDAENVAESMTAAANKGIDYTKKTYNPYLQFGKMGLDQYASLMRNPSRITSDPGYKFQLDQGMQGLERSAAAEGGLLSGQTLVDVTKYNQDYASTAFDKALQRRLAMIGVGQEATAGAVEGVTAGYNQIGEAEATEAFLKTMNRDQALSGFMGSGSGGSSNSSTSFGDVWDAGKSFFDSFGGASTGSLAAAGITGSGLGFGTTAGTAGALGTGGFASGVGSSVGAGGAAAGVPGMGATAGAWEGMTSGIGSSVTGGSANASTLALNPGMAVLAVPFIAMAIDKMTKGGSVESAKSGKLAAQLKRDIQADPSGKKMQTTLTNLITGKLWPGEGNQWVVHDLIRNGVLKANDPRFFSKNSVINYFETPDQMLNYNGYSLNKRATDISSAYGLNAAQKQKLEIILWQSSPANRNKSEGWRESATAQLKALLGPLEAKRRAFATKQLASLKAQGYKGDVSSLTSYLAKKNVW